MMLKKRNEICKRCLYMRLLSGRCPGVECRLGYTDGAPEFLDLLDFFL